MRSNIGSLYPTIYNGVLETDILTEIEDKQFNKYFEHMDTARRNQFVQTADVQGIEDTERIYRIRANPQTEDLDFRRQRLLLRMQTAPPFTMPFLRERLDKIIGVGKYRAWLTMGERNYILGSWQLGRKSFRESAYTLNVSAVTPDTNWYHEVHVLIGRIKPGNIIFSFFPMMTAMIGITETISQTNTKWHYKLNGGWKLGATPFSSMGNPEVVKMPDQKSLKESFFNLHANFTAAEVAKVLINNTVEVTVFLQKDAQDGVTTIRYVLSDGHGLNEIINIKLLRDDDTILSESAVYIPVTDMVTLQHIFNHGEVMANATN